MNPLVQRLLISLTAGSAAGGAWVATAKNKHKKARKRRRKKKTDIVIGTQARKDAAEEFTPGMTLAQLGARVRTFGAGVVDSARSLVGLSPRDPAADGSARDADEIHHDGKRIKNPARKRRNARLAKGHAKKRKGSRRKQASLFDSAKESLRQVVKDEAKRAVQEQVDKTGLGKAAEALKSAGGAVVEKAKAVKDAIPEDLDERLAEAGKNVVEGAKRVGESVGGAIQEGLRKLDGEPGLPGGESQEDGEGLSAEELAQRVGKGVDALGSWLQGPGAPGYKNSGRVRPSSSGSGVVEAKEPASTPAQMEHTPSAGSSGADIPGPSTPDLSSDLTSERTSEPPA